MDAEGLLWGTVDFSILSPYGRLRILLWQCTHLWVFFPATWSSVFRPVCEPKQWHNQMWKLRHSHNYSHRDKFYKFYFWLREKYRSKDGSFINKMTDLCVKRFCGHSKLFTFLFNQQTAAVTPSCCHGDKTTPLLQAPAPVQWSWVALLWSHLQHKSSVLRVVFGKNSGSRSVLGYELNGLVTRSLLPRYDWKNLGIFANKKEEKLGSSSWNN